MKQYASIFNDVLGPVMSGPSSSCTAASVRVGYIMQQMLPGKLKEFTVEFDKDGALAPCYHPQWVDMGLCAGLLGMLPDDERLKNAMEMTEEAGLKTNFVVSSFENNHPNTYKMVLENEAGDKISARALSIGGGMIEFIEVEGYEVSIQGGFYETLAFIDDSNADGEERANSGDFTAKLEEIIEADFNSEYRYSENRKESLYIIKTEKALKDSEKAALEALPYMNRLITIAPVLPVTSQLEPHVPFLYTDELLSMAKEKEFEMWEMGRWYECERGGLTEEEAYEKMAALVKVMQRALKIGLAGTEYENRILGCQSKFFDDPAVKKKVIPNPMTNEIIKAVSAFMEVKSAMEIFVAAPTGGSCGCLPGTTLAVANFLELSEDQIIKAMFAAGIIGIFLAERATFAAEVGGCQAECGSGSGMTAAALVQLMDGSLEECCAAASMALQNVFGMTCDPVAMLVEVPCLGKNIMAGVNAFTSANMALAGFDHVVPLDETIDSFYEVGKLLPVELRSTGLAGLSTVPCSREISVRLGLTE